MIFPGRLGAVRAGQRDQFAGRALEAVFTAAVHRTAKTTRFRVALHERAHLSACALGCEFPTPSLNKLTLMAVTILLITAKGSSRAGPPVRSR